MLLLQFHLQTAVQPPLPCMPTLGLDDMNRQVAAFPDPKAKGALVKAGVNIVVGAAKFLTMSNPAQLMQGVTQLAEAAKAKLVRMYNDCECKPV